MFLYSVVLVALDCVDTVHSRSPFLPVVRHVAVGGDNSRTPSTRVNAWSSPTEQNDFSAPNPGEYENAPSRARDHSNVSLQDHHGRTRPVTAPNNAPAPATRAYHAPSSSVGRVQGISRRRVGIRLVTSDARKCSLRDISKTFAR